MVAISQRRRHPRWRMLFAVVVFSSFVRRCELTSTKRLTDAGSSSSSPSTLSRGPGETRSQNPGSPNDLAWQAWLLVDSQTGVYSGLDSASFLRRITPKSVFIAPELSALSPCADGYQADTMGRCVKNVNIDQEAHFVFLLQQLNNRYGNRASGGDTFNNNQKKSNGPLQLNIPLLPSTNSQSLKVDHEETRDTIKVPVVISPQETNPIENNRPPEPVVRTKDTNNSIKLKDEEFTFFPAESSNPSFAKDREDAPSKFEAIVPVAEFPVDDANETNPIEDKQPPEPVIRTQDTKNNAKLKDEEFEFFPADFSIPSSEKDSEDTSSKFDDIDPITEFPVDDANETSPIEDRHPPEPVVRIQDTKNSTKLKDEEFEFFPADFSITSSGKDHEDTTVPVAEFPIDDVNETNPIEDKQPQEAELTVRTQEDTNNSTKLKDEEFAFFFADFRVPPSGKDREDAPTKFDDIVPVAEFPVDDANETNFSEVVDYKIPIDMKVINISDVQSGLKNGSQFLNATEASPMLILLPSATTSPNLVIPDIEDPEPDNDTNHMPTAWESNATKNVTDKEVEAA
nr:uncharacterized protein LOC116425405 isoform X2 [Nomia melanderi]